MATTTAVGVRTSSTGGGITAEASGKAAATEPDI